MANIQILHLLSGEDVLGELNGIDHSSNPAYTTLKNPCIIMLVPDPQNPERVGVQLRPLCPFSTDKTITINETAVVYRSTPVQELENQYNTLFGSGIVIAGPGSLPAKGSGGAPNLTRIK